MSHWMQRRWKTVVVVILAATGAVLFASASTGMWFLTAAPVGFLFGFFLERSDLCGASAFSEVILMKETRKLEGLLVVIVTSMVLFAIADGLGLITLNPKPLAWATNLVGGIIFGVGTVLAGGCISGTLFKAGQGNMNSMAALAAIPIGISLVEYGPLRPFSDTLAEYVVRGAGGGPVTLSSVTGIPYWLLAVIFGLATLATAIWLRRRRKGPERPKEGPKAPLGERIFTRPWRPWQSGIAIAVLALAAYMSSAASGRNYPLGVTHGVLYVQVLMTDYPVQHVWGPAKKDAGPSKEGESAPQPRKKVVWWLVLEVLFLVLGSYTSARMRGRFLLKPKPPDEMLIAFVGGILVGIGAGIAGGCVVGNIMSGVALMSVGNILFFAAVVLANWATTYIYMMGAGGRL